MANIIGVRFQSAGKLYFFDAKNMWPTPGDFVIVETSRGIEFGEMVTAVQSVDETKLTSPLMPLHRIASAQDVAHHEENLEKEKWAQQQAKRKIMEHDLEMKLVRAAYTFDNSKLMFYYTAEGRIDFRALVKDLAAMFHVRIEMRQIGARDEAKMLGGLGPCGRPLCCSKFLGDFQPVSIKMAKEQNLSLNPTKISGVCGRLMCCLKFEQDHYETMHKLLPKQGKDVVTPDGPGVVLDVNVITERIKVRVQKGDSTEIKEYPAEQVVKPGMVPPAPTEQQLHDVSSLFSDTQASTPSYVGKHAPRREQPEQAAENSGGRFGRRQRKKEQGDHPSRPQRQGGSNKPHPRKEQRTADAPAQKNGLRTPIKRDAAAKRPVPPKQPHMPMDDQSAPQQHPGRKPGAQKAMASPVLRSNTKGQQGGPRQQSTWLSAVQEAKQRVARDTIADTPPRHFPQDDDDTI